MNPRLPFVRDCPSCPWLSDLFLVLCATTRSFLRVLRRFLGQCEPGARTGKSDREVAKARRKTRRRKTNAVFLSFASVFVDIIWFLVFFARFSGAERSTPVSAGDRIERKPNAQKAQLSHEQDGQSRTEKEKRVHWGPKVRTVVPLSPCLSVPSVAIRILPSFFSVASVSPW